MSTQDLLDHIQNAAEPALDDYARGLADHYTGPELTVALRKLLEAADAISRADEQAARPAAVRGYEPTATCASDHCEAVRLALNLGGDIAIVGSVASLDRQLREGWAYESGRYTSPHGATQVTPIYGDNPGRLRGQNLGAVIFVPGTNGVSQRWLDCARLCVRYAPGLILGVTAGKVREYKHRSGWQDS